MGISPSMNPNGQPDVLVDKMIGTAYKRVKHVAQNIEYVKHVSHHLFNVYEVSQHLETIEFLKDNLPNINSLWDNISNNIANIEIVSNNINDIVNVSNNIPELYNKVTLILEKSAQINDQFVEISLVTTNAINAIVAERAAAIAEMDPKVEAAEDARDDAAISAAQAMLYGPLTWPGASELLADSAVPGTVIGKRGGLQSGGSVDFVAADTGDFNLPASPAIGANVVPFGMWMDAETFGVKGDYNQSTGTGTDDTAALERAIKAARRAHKRLILTGKQSRVTDTLHVYNDSSLSSGFVLHGWNGNNARIWLDTTVEDTNLIFLDDDTNYFEMDGVELVSKNGGVGRGIYFQDDRDSSGPNWKHLISRCRITNFEEGVLFDGGVTQSQDAHLDGVTFLHSKFRNNRTGVTYNNTQAVNHLYLNTDLENDQEGAEAWTHFNMLRGATINHLGGSVIGRGSYLKYLYSEAGGFQSTSQFVAKGVRVEKRGANTVPVIDHDPASTLTLSNNLRVLIEGMPVVYGDAATEPVFARIGGQTYLELANIHGSRVSRVDAYMTSNLAANSQTGSIDMSRSNKALRYNRVSDVAAYGGTGVLSNNYKAIPAIIGNNTEGTNNGTNQPPVDARTQVLRGGGFQRVENFSLAISPADAAGLGAGNDNWSTDVYLPIGARPTRLRLLRDDILASATVVLSLYFVAGGTEYLAATITPTVDAGGHYSEDVRLTSGLGRWIVDGTNWNGLCRVKKTGATGQYNGLIIIDYM